MPHIDDQASRSPELPSVAPLRELGGNQETDGQLQAVLTILKEQIGRDYTSYKTNTVMRRIERRMTITDTATLTNYVAILQGNPLEVQALSDDILIGVTSFFRDPEAFQVLRSHVIPRLFADKKPGDTVRIWHACCATGEEVYSTAILIREFLNEHRLDTKVQFFASDIDEASVAHARAGIFPDSISANVDENRLCEFFTKSGDTYQVSQQLREMIIFATHNLLKDPPFSRLDLLVCRNFFIYLNPDRQKQLISLFHHILKPGGFLFLGNAETVGHLSEMYNTIDKKWKIFERRDSAQRFDLLPPFGAAAPKYRSTVPARRSPGVEEPAPGQRAEALLMERYSPPCIVVNDRYEVVHFSTRTNNFLEPPVGEPTRDVLKMARTELRPALRAAIYKCFSEQTPVAFRGIRVGTVEEDLWVNVLAEPFESAEQPRKLAMVIFESDSPMSALPAAPSGEEGAFGSDASKDSIILQLEEQLRITHEQLQAVIAQLETSNEAFMSANEELLTINEEFQSTNEELQSTNEELETSKEELQALNEELVTVNAELQVKVEQLHRTNTDLENFLNSSEIATIFLDRNLKIMRFTTAMAALFNLIPQDIGRPFHHMAGKIDWPKLSQDAESVQMSGAPIQREAILENGQCHLMRVLPYVTKEGQVDGIVVTLMDITERKRSEEYTRHLASFPQLNPSPVLEVKSGEILFFNAAAKRTLEKLGLPRIDVTPFLPKDLDEIVKNLAKKQETSHYCEIVIKNKVFAETIHLVPLTGIARIYALDITKRKKAEKALESARAEAVSEQNLLMAVMESLPVGVAIVDAVGGRVRQNRKYQEIWRGPSSEAKIPEHSPTCRAWWAETGIPVKPEEWASARAIRDSETIVGQLMEIECFDGSRAYVHNCAAPIFDAGGRTIGSAVAIMDVTDQMKAEAARHESEERFRAIVNAISGCVWNFQKEDGLNRESLQWWEEITGQRPAELAEHGLVAMVHPEDKRNVLEFMAILDNGRMYSTVCRIRRRGGSWVWIAVNGVPLPSADGSIREWVGTFTDISDRKQAEELLKIAHDELELRILKRTAELARTVDILRKEVVEKTQAKEALSLEMQNRMQAVEKLRENERLLIQQSRHAAMGEMIGNIAHQWRQPLNALGLMIQELQINYEFGDFRKEYLDGTVRKSMQLVQHMSQTIDDFRNFFKPNKEKAAFSVRDNIARTISMVEKSFEYQGIKITFESEGDVLTVGYANEFSQVILNILNNARDAFLERGVEAPTLEIRIIARDGKAHITITDNAGGIPEEIMDKLFDPYFSTKGPSSGTGIGLFMSKVITEKNMNGRLTVRNTGKGAQFIIELRESPLESAGIGE